MFNLVRKSFTLSSRVNPYFALALLLSDYSISKGFSTSSRSAYDVAKLTLVGRLAREPELRVTKRDKEYVASVKHGRKLGEFAFTDSLLQIDIPSSPLIIRLLQSQTRVNHSVPIYL